MSDSGNAMNHLKPVQFDPLRPIVNRAGTFWNGHRRILSAGTIMSGKTRTTTASSEIASDLVIPVLLISDRGICAIKFCHPPIHDSLQLVREVG